MYLLAFDFSWFLRHKVPYFKAWCCILLFCNKQTCESSWIFGNKPLFGKRAPKCYLRQQRRSVSSKCHWGDESKREPKWEPERAIGSVWESQLDPERTGDRARVIQREPGGARNGETLWLILWLWLLNRHYVSRCILNYILKFLIWKWQKCVSNKSKI